MNLPARADSSRGFLTFPSLDEGGLLNIFCIVQTSFPIRKLVLNAKKERALVIEALFQIYKFG